MGKVLRSAARYNRAHLRTYAPTHLRTYAPTHLRTYAPTHKNNTPTHQKYAQKVQTKTTHKNYAQKLRTKTALKNCAHNTNFAQKLKLFGWVKLGRAVSDGVAELSRLLRACHGLPVLPSRYEHELATPPTYLRACVPTDLHLLAATACFC